MLRWSSIRIVRGFNGCKALGLGPVYIDFSAADMLYRRKSGHNEPLGRAIGVKGDKRPKVFDATAGLGRDAFVLADLGCSVALSEQSAPLCYLLEQARELALMSANDKVVEAVSRMRVLCGDSRQQAVEGFDVIYIDPMFPERGKTAAVKKDLATVQALHSIVPRQTILRIYWGGRWLSQLSEL